MISEHNPVERGKKGADGGGGGEGRGLGGEK